MTRPSAKKNSGVRARSRGVAPGKTRGKARESARAAALIVSVSTDGVRSPVATATLAALARRVLAAEHIPRALLSITLLTRRAMATLNRRHLGHRGPTDVITFAMGRDPGGVLVGDVYICADVARVQARDLGVGVREEVARLVVHGVLHSCGRTHPEGDARMRSAMWRRQEVLVARFWPPATSP